MKRVYGTSTVSREICSAWLCAASIICAFLVSCGPVAPATPEDDATGLEAVSSPPESRTFAHEDSQAKAVAEVIHRFSPSKGLPLPSSVYVAGAGRYLVYRRADTSGPRGRVWLYRDLQNAGPAKEVWSIEDDAIRQPIHIAWSLCRRGNAASTLVALVSEFNDSVHVFDLRGGPSAGWSISGPSETKSERGIRGVCVAPDSWLVTADLAANIRDTQRFRFVEPESPQQKPWRSEPIDSNGGIVADVVNDGTTCVLVREADHSGQGHPSDANTTDLDVFLMDGHRILRSMRLSRVRGLPVLSPSGNHIAFMRESQTGQEQVVIQAVGCEDTHTAAAVAIVGVGRKTVVVESTENVGDADDERIDICILSLNGSELLRIREARGVSICKDVLYFYSQSDHALKRISLAELHDEGRGEAAR